MPSHHPLRLLRRWFPGLLALCWWLPVSAYMAEAAANRNFDLPADSAETALKRFSLQAGIDVVFATSSTANVRTNAVVGSLTPAEAMEQLLAGTPLAASRISATGAFSVTTRPKAARATPTTPDAARTNAVDYETTIELSPFTVSVDKDVGYVATSSLAGSRLNTPLRDTAASISVLTAEFLSDIAANDLTEALQWSNNTQLFMNEAGANDNEDILSFRTFRVRGIPADVTRNYFRWQLSTDSYNVDRIEEQRGPNSVLFGIGGAGGILNSSTKRANLGRDFRRVGVQTGSYESYRGTLDVNQRVLDGRLGVRFNAVYSHQGNFRFHTFSETRRLHLATTFRVTSRTTLRAEYETGDIDQVTSRNGNGHDEITRWLDAGRPTIAAAIPSNAANTATLANLGLLNYGTAARLTWIGNTGQLFDLRNRNVSNGRGSIIQETTLVDRRVNTGGPSQKRFGNFNTVSAFAEHRFGQNTFAELAYNHQEERFTAYIAGQGATENTALRADPHQFLPNGQPNPFAGQLMFEGPRWMRRVNERRVDSTRLSISHEQNFGRWGAYRFAVLGEYEWRVTKNKSEVEVWADRAFANNNQGPEATPNLVYRRNYVVEGDWKTYYINGPAETGLIQNLTDPVTGRTYSSTWAPWNINIDDNPEYQKTLQIGGQARYFKDRLVAGFGFRQDSLDLTKRIARRALTANGLPGEFTQYYDDARYESFSSNTKTLGLVAHLPWSISAHYNYSNSFSLPNTNLRILPDSRLMPNPESEGSDYGLSVVLFDGRVNARLNRFITDLKGAQFNGFGGSANRTDLLTTTVLNAFVANGIITQAEMDQRVIFMNGATGDRRVEGYELGVTANLTKNWRLQANYSITEGYDSNSAPEVKAWAAENIPYFLRHANLVAQDGRTVGAVVAAWQEEVQNYWDLEGLTLLGNRRDKWNVFTRYNLPGELLKGAFIGGGYRYFGRSELGIDANNRIRYGNDYGMVDLLCGYRIARVPYLKSGITIQLNVANALNLQDPITTRFNADGTVNRWNILEPRTWRLNISAEF